MNNYHPLIGSTNSGGGNWNIFANTEWDDLNNSVKGSSTALMSSVQESYFYGLNIRNLSMRYARQNYRRLSGTTEGTATALYRMTESQMDRLTGGGAVPLPVSYFDMVTTTPGLGSYINEWAISNGVSSGPLLSGKHSFMASMFAGIGGAIDSNFEFNKQTNTDPYFQDSYRVNQTDTYNMQKDGPAATALGNSYQFLENASYAVISYLAVAYPLSAVSDKIISNFTESLLTGAIQGKGVYSAGIRTLSGMSGIYNSIDRVEFNTDAKFYEELKRRLKNKNYDPYYFHNNIARASASDMWNGTLDLITHIASPFKVGSADHMLMQAAGQAVGLEIATPAEFTMDASTGVVRIKNTGIERARNLATKLDDFLQYIPVNPLLWSWGGINPNQSTISNGFTSLRNAISLTDAVDSWKNFFDNGRIQAANLQISGNLTHPVIDSFRLAYRVGVNYVKELFHDFYQQRLADEFYKKSSVIDQKTIEDKANALEDNFKNENTNSTFTREQFIETARTELELEADRNIINQFGYGINNFFRGSANYLYGRTKQMMNKTNNKSSATLEVTKEGHLTINLLDNPEKLEKFEKYIQDIAPVQRRIERQLRKQNTALIIEKTQNIERESEAINLARSRSIWANKAGKYIVLGTMASFLISRAASDLFNVNTHASQLTQMLVSATGRREYGNWLTQGQNVSIEPTNIVDLSDILLAGQATGMFGQGIGIGSHPGETSREYQQRYSDTISNLHTVQSVAGIGVTLAAGYVAGRRGGRGNLEITLNLGEEGSETYTKVQSILKDAGMSLEGKTLTVAGGKKLGLNLKVAGLAAIGVSWLMPNAINIAAAGLRTASRFIKGIFGLGPSLSARKYLNMNADASSYLEGYFSNIKAQVMLGKNPSRSSLEAALMARFISKNLDIYTRPDEQVINTTEGNVIIPVQTVGNLAMQAQTPILTPQMDIENNREAGSNTGQYFISEGFRGPMLLGYNMTVGSPIGFDFAHPLKQGALGLGIIYSPQSNNYLNYMADLTQTLSAVDIAVSAFAALSIIFRLPPSEYQALQQINTGARILAELPTQIIIGGLRMAGITPKNIMATIRGIITRTSPASPTIPENNNPASQSAVNKTSTVLIDHLPKWLKTSAALETGAIAAWSLLSTDERFGFATGMHLDPVNINDPNQAAPDTYTWYLRGTTFIASVATWYMAGNFKSMTDFENRYRHARARIVDLENKVETARRSKTNTEIVSADADSPWAALKKRATPVYDELKLFYWKNKLANLSFAGRRVNEVDAYAISTNSNNPSSASEPEELTRPKFGKLRYFTEISGQQQKIFRFFKTQIIISMAVGAIAYVSNQAHAGNMEEFYHWIRNSFSIRLPGSGGKKTIGDLFVDTYKLNNWFSSDNNGYTGITSASYDIKNGSVYYGKLQYKPGTKYLNINSSQLVQSSPVVAKNYDDTVSNLRKINGEIQIARGHKSSNLTDTISNINSLTERTPYLPIPLIGGIKMNTAEIPNSHNSFYIQFQSPGIDLSMSEYSIDSKFFFEQAAAGRDDIENMLREIRQNSSGNQNGLATYIKYITASIPTRNRARNLHIPLSNETKNLINQSSISRSVNMDKLARLQVLSYQTPRQMAANRLRRQLEKLNYGQILQIIKNTSTRNSEKNNDSALYNSNLETNMDRLSITNMVDFHMNHTTNETVSQILDKFNNRSANTDITDNNENIYKSAEFENTEGTLGWLGETAKKIGNATDILTGLPVIGYYAGLALTATVALTGLYGLFAAFNMLSRLGNYTNAAEIHSELSYYYQDSDITPSEIKAGVNKIIENNNIKIKDLQWIIKSNNKYYSLKNVSGVTDGNIATSIEEFNNQFKNATKRIKELKQDFGKNYVGIYRGKNAIKYEGFTAKDIFNLTNNGVTGIKEYQVKATYPNEHESKAGELWIDNSGNQMYQTFDKDGNSTGVAEGTNSNTKLKFKRGFNINLEDALMKPFEDIVDKFAESVFTPPNSIYEKVFGNIDNFKTAWKTKFRTRIKQILNDRFKNLKKLNLNAELTKAELDSLVNSIIEGNLFNEFNAGKLKGVEGLDYVFRRVQELVYKEVKDVFKEFELNNGLIAKTSNLESVLNKGKQLITYIFRGKKSPNPENTVEGSSIISPTIQEANKTLINPENEATVVPDNTIKTPIDELTAGNFTKETVGELLEEIPRNIDLTARLIKIGKGRIVQPSIEAIMHTGKGIKVKGIGAVGSAVNATMHIVAAGMEGGRFINLPAASNNLHERMVDPNYSADEAKLSAREYVMGLGQGAVDTALYALIEGTIHVNKVIGYTLMGTTIGASIYDPIKNRFFPNSDPLSVLPDYITSAGTTIASSITKFTIGATGLLGDTYVDIFRPRKDWDPVKRTLMPIVGNFVVGAASTVIEWFGILGLVWGISPLLVPAVAEEVFAGVAAFNLVNWLGSSLIPSTWASWGRGIRRLLQDNIPVVGNLFIGEGETGEYAQILSNQYYFNHSLERPISTDSIRTAEQKALLALRYLPNDITGETTIEYFASGIVNSKTVYLEDPRRSRFVDNNEFLSRTFEPIPLIDSIGSAVLRNRAFKLHQVIAQDEWKKAASNASDRAKLETIQKYKDNYYKTYKSKFNPTTSAKVAHAKHIANVALQNKAVTAAQNKIAVATNPGMPSRVPQTPPSKGCSNLRPSTKTNLCINATSKQVTIEKIASIDFNTAHSIPNYNPQQNIRAGYMVGPASWQPDPIHPDANFITVT